MSPVNRGARTRIAPNVYQDAKGFEAVARVKGRRAKAKRFPRGTKRETILAWQAETCTKLRAAAKDERALFPVGTLAGDVRAYQQTLSARQRQQTKALLAAWVDALGMRRRADLTLADLRGVVAGWVNAGHAASTINHRRRTLVALYEALDGDETKVLPRRLKRQREPAPEARAWPMELLAAIVESMPDRPWRPKGTRVRTGESKAKARLRFMLWAGMAPATLGRMGPHAVSLERAEMTLPSRVKGEGAEGVTLPLVQPQGLTAARQWLRAFAWGPFSQATVYRALATAVRRYRDAHPDTPAHIRPYDFRHSFLTWLARTTGDPLVVQLYAQHASLETTARYMKAARLQMVHTAIAAVSGATRGATRSPEQSRTAANTDGQSTAGARPKS